MRKRNATPFAAGRAYAPANAMPISWRYFVLIIACTGVMAAGFFLAARQHFNTMDLGMKNSKLRRQIEELNAEQRRLILAREVALSPASIRKTARGLGFVEKGAAAITVASARPVPPAVAKGTVVKTEATVPPAGRVVKTALTTRASNPPPAPDKKINNSLLQKERNDRDYTRLVAELR